MIYLKIVDKKNGWGKINKNKTLRHGVTYHIFLRNLMTTGNYWRNHLKVRIVNFTFSFKKNEKKTVEYFAKMILGATTPWRSQTQRPSTSLSSSSSSHYPVMLFKTHLHQIYRNKSEPTNYWDSCVIIFVNTIVIFLQAMQHLCPINFIYRNIVTLRLYWRSFAVIDQVFTTL